MKEELECKWAIRIETYSAIAKSLKEDDLKDIDKGAKILKLKTEEDSDSETA